MILLYAFAKQNQSIAIFPNNNVWGIVCFLKKINNYNHTQNLFTLIYQLPMFILVLCVYFSTFAHSHILFHFFNFVFARIRNYIPTTQKEKRFFCFFSIHTPRKKNTLTYKKTKSKKLFLFCA